MKLERPVGRKHRPDVQRRQEGPAVHTVQQRQQRGRGQDGGRAGTAAGTGTGTGRVLRRSWEQLVLDEIWEKKECFSSLPPKGFSPAHWPGAPCGRGQGVALLLLAALTSPSWPRQQREGEKIFPQQELVQVHVCSVCQGGGFTRWSSASSQVTGNEEKAHSFIQLVFFSIMGEESTAWTRDSGDVKTWTGGPAALT